MNYHTLAAVLVSSSLVFLFFSMGYDIDYVNGYSRSMSPVLEPGCLLLTRRVVALDEVSVGDIIIYKEDLNNSIIKVIHRVQIVDEETLRTKGDSNLYWDAPIVWGQVDSKVLEWWCP